MAKYRTMTDEEAHARLESNLRDVENRHLMHSASVNPNDEELARLQAEADALAAKMDELKGTPVPRASK